MFAWNPIRQPENIGEGHGEGLAIPFEEVVFLWRPLTLEVAYQMHHLPRLELRATDRDALEVLVVEALPWVAPDETLRGKKVLEAVDLDGQVVDRDAQLRQQPMQLVDVKPNHPWCRSAAKISHAGAAAQLQSWRNQQPRRRADPFGGHFQADFVEHIPDVTRIKLGWHFVVEQR